MALNLTQSRGGLYWRFVVPVAAVFSVGIVALAVYLMWVVDPAPAKQLVAGLLVLLAMTLGGLHLLFRRAIGQPFKNLTEMVEQLETGVPVESGGGNEIYRVTTSIKAFVENVAQLTRQAASVTTELEVAVEKTAASAAQTTLDIDNQKTEADQVVQVVASMSASAREMAETGRNARAAASTVNTDAARGREVVGEAVSSIQALAGDVDNAAQVLRNLERHSESIGAVLDVIRGIAEQTNLLALNAAIEAARAGEQGRGFAVVADEVRTLASRTQSSTQEIQEMIERLQNGTQSAVAAMTQGHTRAEATVEHAKRAGEALDAIAEGVVTITDLNESMASAAQTQNGMADQVQERVEKIRELANHSAQQSRQGAAASEEVSRRSSDLINKIGMFNF